MSGQLCDTVCRAHWRNYRIANLHAHRIGHFLKAPAAISTEKTLRQQDSLKSRLHALPIALPFLFSPQRLDDEARCNMDGFGPAGNRYCSWSERLARCHLADSCFPDLRHPATAHEHHTVEEIDMGEPIDAILWIHVGRLNEDASCGAEQASMLDFR